METQKKPVPPSDDIDLMRYVSLFISNWMWIAAALFLALSVAYIYNRYSQRVYSVGSTLLIKEEQNSGAIANMEQLFAGDMYNPYPNLDDEVAIIKSYTLNYRVIEDLPELHVAYVPVARNGIKGQRTYKTSPFVLRKLTDDQPSGVPLNIRLTGPDTYTVEVDDDHASKPAPATGGWKKHETDRELGLEKYMTITVLIVFLKSGTQQRGLLPGAAGLPGSNHLLSWQTATVTH